jgi:hypothetical protein
LLNLCRNIVLDDARAAVPSELSRRVFKSSTCSVSTPVTDIPTRNEIFWSLTNLLPDSNSAILNNNNIANNFFKKRYVTYFQTLLEYSYLTITELHSSISRNMTPKPVEPLTILTQKYMDL